MSNDTTTTPPRALPRMEFAVYLTISIGVGMLNALQFGMIGGMSRLRGGFEATWVSMLGSITGMAILLGILSFAVRSPTLPTPFTNPWLYVMLSLMGGVTVVAAARGLSMIYMATGLLAIPILLAAAIVGPRIGLAVYFAAIVTGQLTGSVILDHLGAFGATERSIDLIRIAGLGVLLLGIIMIRGRG